MTASPNVIAWAEPPLETLGHHHDCLEDAYMRYGDTWTIASLMLTLPANPKASEHPGFPLQTAYDYQLIHVEAYIVSVDLVSRNEVAFKLTQHTVDQLVEYHRRIYSPPLSAAAWNCSPNEVRFKGMQDRFELAMSEFTFCAHVHALEGPEEDGAGEVVEGLPGVVKAEILDLFLPSTTVLPKR